jgi:hypothetical protein
MLAIDLLFPEPQHLPDENKDREVRYDAEADDDDEDDVMLNDELRRIWMEDDADDTSEALLLNAKMCRELMLLRSKSKITKSHMSDMLQLIHRCCQLTPLQKRFIPPDYTHVDKMYKQSRAVYIKVRPHPHTYTPTHTHTHTHTHIHHAYTRTLTHCVCV